MGVSGWLKWLRRDSYIFKATRMRTKFVVKDFRACHNLLNHVLDGHIIALFGAAVEAKNVAELCEILEKENINWRKLVKNAQIRYSSPAVVDKLRKMPDNERDVPYENAILFLQHGIMYRDFVLAMRTGDVGRMECCLRMFTVWFQGSGANQYARELLHLMASIKYRWTTEFHEFWQQTLLVNASGSAKGFMPPDLLNEWLVREFKRHIRATSHGKGFDFVLRTLTPLSFTSRHCRKQIVKDTGATYYYKHSVTVGVWTDIKSIANRLLQTRVFKQTPGRLVPVPHGVAHDLISDLSKPEAQISRSEATDLYHKGLSSLSNGLAILNYKTWLRRRQDIPGHADMDEHSSDGGGEEDWEPMEDVGEQNENSEDMEDLIQIMAEFLDDEDGY